MNNNIEITPNPQASRRKFVWGLGALSVFAAIAGATGIPFLSRKKPLANAANHGKKTVKMLTQDGRLVEIDQALLSADVKKVSITELKNWIKK